MGLLFRILTLNIFVWTAGCSFAEGKDVLEDSSSEIGRLDEFDQYSYQNKSCMLEPFEKLSIKIEPSGLYWDSTLSIFVGVTDNYNDIRSSAGRYAIFWFDMPKDGEQTCLAKPLLTDKEANEVSPFDLEGLARADDGTYFATSSLALHPTKKERDVWYRFQAYRFKIQGSREKGFTVSDLQVLSAERRRDLREYFLSNAPFTVQQIQGRAESEGGLNVEGLSLAPDGNLLFGLRGPMKAEGTAYLFKTAVPQPSEEPTLKEILSLRMPEIDYAIRGIDRTRTAGEYVLLSGPTDREKDELYAFSANLKGGYSAKVGLPENFVAEGIAVIDYDDQHNRAIVAIVDDLAAKFIVRSIPLPSR